MAQAMTSADVLLANNAEAEIGVILQVLADFPELRVFPASPIPKTVYKTLKITADPAAGFRSVNAGRTPTKATFGTDTVTCKLLDGSWDIDGGAIKEVDDDPTWVFNAVEAAAWRGVMAKLCTQIWRGTNADANGFAGIHSIYYETDGTNVVDGGGTGTDLCSVYLLNFDQRSFNLCWGHEGQLDIGPVYEGVLPTSDGSTIHGYLQKIMGWCGLQLSDVERGCRIANLEDDSSNSLTDAKLAEAIAKFRVGKQPTSIWMNRAMQRRLRDSRTATNPTGAPAPFPDEAFGIPIIVTDSLPQTESQVTATTTTA